MHKVLVTGISGFLGAQIAETLIQNNVKVIGLKRTTSDTWRCKKFEHQIDWVDISGNWKDIIIEKEPESIIHCAWIGVGAKDRDNWPNQIKNIYLLSDLLEISQSCKINKFIFIGSQAEYGNVTGKISEDERGKALNAYGSIKLACQEILTTYCELNNINWIWLRLFSVFGEKENEAWLIPSLISNMQTKQEMDFTNADQKYAYLYIKDFAKIITRVLLLNINSGIYNVSSEEAMPLRSLIEIIRDKVNPAFKLNFGALPYRAFQPMHLEGNIAKLIEQIGKPEFTDFSVALQNTITYYTSKFNTNEGL